MNLFTVIGITVASAVLVVFLRTSRPEMALLTAIMAGIVIVALILKDATPLLSKLQNLMYEAGINSEYIKIMLKSLGICYITGFTADTCNDFGQTSLASKVELCGKIALLAISLPMCTSIINVITEIIG